MKQNLQFFNNYPLISFCCESYEEYLGLAYKASVVEIQRSDILASKLPPKFANLDGTIYLKDDDKGTREKLSQSIKDKKVFVDMNGVSEILPTDLNLYYIFDSYDDLKAHDFIKQNGAKWIKKNDPKFDIYEVIPTKGEKTLNELYQNAFKYLFNYDKLGYFLTSEKTAAIKFMKGAIRNKVAMLYGDLSDRVADYSRLIYALYKICEPLMNEKQKEMFDFILHHTPSDEELKNIDAMEKRVLSEIYGFKGRA